jgi:hypothetical protein
MAPAPGAWRALGVEEPRSIAVSAGIGAESTVARCLRKRTTMTNEKLLSNTAVPSTHAPRATRLAWLGALALACVPACGSVDPTLPGEAPPEVVLRGPSADAALGRAFGSAGDFDGDGHADLVVGVPGDGFTVSGRAFIARGPFANAKTTLGQGTAIEIVGEQLEHVVGTSVQGIGDFDGDGLGDVAISATEACTHEPGCFHDCLPPVCTAGPVRTYLVHGRAGSGPISLADVAAGNGGSILEAAGADLDSPTFHPLGDVNADGLSDFALGAYGFDGHRGRVFVVFGRASTEPIRLSDLEAGQGGYAIDRPAGYDGEFALSIANAGDVNSDGLADLLLGAPSWAEGAPGGRAFVVFGKTAGPMVAAGEPGVGFTVLGEEGSGESCCGRAGHALATAGDVDGDGLADLFVAAPWFGDLEHLQSGRVYVVFGKSDGATIDLANVATGQGGYALMGNRLEQLGFYVATSPIDHDGDGVPDVLTSNGNDDNQIFLGKPGATVDDPASFVSFAPATPGKWALSEHSSVGDLNGDGTPDLVLVGYYFDESVGRLLVIHR